MREILKDITDIEFVLFDREDVVRHKIVQRIVEAYREVATTRAPRRGTSGDAVVEVDNRAAPSARRGARWRRWWTACSTAQGATDAEVAMILVDPEPMRGAEPGVPSRRTRSPTCWRSRSTSATSCRPACRALLGDVVICLDRCAEQAAEHGNSPGAELVVLAVHGVLHLLGYDHETDDGAMLALQDER